MPCSLSSLLLSPSLTLFRSLPRPSLLLVFICVAVTIAEAKRSASGYSDSYVFLSVRNTKTGESTRVCANYLQFKEQRIATTAEQAKPVGLGWWRGVEKQTKVCPLPSGQEREIRYSGKAVALDYRIDDDGTACSRPFNEGGASFRNASQFEVNQLQSHDASNAILLLDRGHSFVSKWRDFLFSDFYDPYINGSTSIPTFFLYSKVFHNIVALDSSPDSSSLELRFHRPLDPTFDLSMIFIWLLAMGCVAGGGAWAFVRHRAGKDKSPLAAPTKPLSDSDSAPSTFSSPDGCCHRHGNAVAIVTLMIFLVTILMLGFFFRRVLVMFFNFLLMVFGSFSVFGCVHAFLSNFQCCVTSKCSTTLCTVFPELDCISHRPTVSNVLLYLASLSLCAVWFVFRREPYAFILLDFINITLCLHILKTLRLPSLKWISTLMLCMFIYDAVMVFVTPLWTKNGCSVMLEVATGIDCAASSSPGYPMPPIDVDLPEKFPMLMQVMHFDPMMECIDLEVERGYQMTILGLGDIIIPGYLVTHCFTMNGIGERARIIYGIVCIIGYGVGLLVTFVALTLMNMAQPALIYLVPFTLFPIIVLASLRKEFRKVWYGVPIDDTTKSTTSETGPLQLSMQGAENDIDHSDVPSQV